MKQLHRPNLWGFSLFNAERNFDFHSVFWSRPAGNVLIDPLPLTPHDAEHLDRLGGVRHHPDQLRSRAGGGRAARAYVRPPVGAEAELAFLESLGARALDAEHTLGADLQVLELSGSKTPGEPCLNLEGETLVVGDLIRGHRAGRLNLLPDAKLGDKALAIGSLEALTRRGGIDARRSWATVGPYFAGALPRCSSCSESCARADPAPY